MESLYLHPPILEQHGVEGAVLWNTLCSPFRLNMEAIEDFIAGTQIQFTATELKTCTDLTYKQQVSAVKSLEKAGLITCKEEEGTLASWTFRFTQEGVGIVIETLHFKIADNDKRSKYLQ